MGWDVRGGSTSRDILALILIASMTTTEAIKREPQREATGTTAPPTPTDLFFFTPEYVTKKLNLGLGWTGGGAIKKNHGGRKPNLQPARSFKQHENRVIDPKHRDTLKRPL